MHPGRGGRFAVRLLADLLATSPDRLRVIVVENLSLRQGDFAIEGVGFSIPRGQYAVVMGKTGSGKTSLLEAICGLRPIQTGVIRLMNREVQALRPALRGIGYVPQDGALFTTMTVRDHLEFSLKLRKWPAKKIEDRVDELAQLLGIPHLLSRYPRGLSGGESQRVSLGRALAAHPGILCLDEPLSALDDDTRQEMYDLLKTVQQKTEVTTLHVTHSLEEAAMLADLVLHVHDRQVETATATEFFQRRSHVNRDKADLMRLANMVKTQTLPPRNGAAGGESDSQTQEVSGTRSDPSAGEH